MKDSAQHILRGCLVLALALHLVGCESPSVATATDVNPSAWESPALITLSNADTVTLRDMGIFLRCNDHFTEDTLTVRITLSTPGSLRHEEPFRLVIPHEETPAAIMREIAIPYRQRVQLARLGRYRLSITPCRPVRGVEAVGIHLVKSN